MSTNNYLAAFNKPVDLTTSTSQKIQIGPSTVMFIGVICLLSIFVKNGLFVFSCLISLIFILKLLWEYNRPGILVFAFLLQWSQVVTYVFWMNAMNFDINRYSESAGTAVLISCLGLMCISSVVFFMTSKLPKFSKEQLMEQVMLINEKKLLLLYIISTIFLTSLGFIFGISSGVTQFLISVSSIKWVIFMLYGYLVFMKKKGKLIFILIIIYEFSTSLYSFFSSFKEVIFFSIILALTFIIRIKFRQFLYVLITTIFLAALMVTWSAIKGTYRQYLNQGSRRQEITVERGDAFNKLQDQIGNITWQKYELALYMSLYRLQYIHNLALAMDRVPDVVPYQNGKVWFDNISFVVTPRILFPEKAMYNASEKANIFTGKKYAGLKEGSSFSLGYFGDSYVDFGYVGMFVPLFFIGLFVAFIYRVFYKMNRLNILFRFAIINACLYNFIFFEADGLFLFGRLLNSFIVFWLFSKTVFPYLQNWLYKK
jgi:hypothetical protein